MSTQKNNTQHHPYVSGGVVSAITATSVSTTSVARTLPEAVAATATTTTTNP